MIGWRGDPDPIHIRAVDAYWVTAAEHGMNASTFTARVVASTGADVAACLSAAVGALSGPLHGGAPARVQVTPTSTFDWIVKNANVLSARFSGLPPKNPGDVAEMASWMTMPATTHAAVRANHGRAQR